VEVVASLSQGRAVRLVYIQISPGHISTTLYDRWWVKIFTVEL